MRDFEDVVDVECGAPSRVFDVFVRLGAEQIVGEGAQARDDVGVLADARSVLGEGHVAHVMTAVLNAPVGADPFVPAIRRRAKGRRNPEDGLARSLAKSSRRIALIDSALQPKHGLDQFFPRRMAEPRLGWECGQLARFPAIAARGLAFRGPARLTARRSKFKLAAQARLIVLDLGQQMIARGDHAREHFF